MSLARSTWLPACVTLLLAGLVALGPAPVVDNSVDALLAHDDPAAATYVRFEEAFGTDEIIVVTLRGEDVDTLLAHTASVAALLAADPATTTTLDPTTIYTDALAVLTDPVFADDADARRSALADLNGPLGRRLDLLGLTPPHATVYAFTRVVPPAEREALTDRLLAARRDAESAGLRVRVAGPPLLNLALDRAGRDVAQLALPLLVVVCLVVCLVVLRSVRATAAVFAPVGLTVLATDRVYAMTGLSTNLVVDIAKPLLFVLLLAGALHLIAAYRAKFDGDALAAADAAVKSKGRAAILALLTTAIGFSSLALADVVPIRRFGVTAAGGLLFGVVTVVVLVPAFAARLWPRPTAAARDPIAGFAVSLVRAGHGQAAASLLLAAATIAAGAWAFTSLPTEPHAIRYFAPDHPLRMDYEALEAGGHGLATLEVVVTSTGAVVDEITQLDRLAADIEALDGIEAVFGLPLLLREATHRTRGADALPDATAARAFLAERPALLSEVLTEDGHHARLAATIQTLDADHLDRLATTIRERAWRDGIEVEVTGSYRLLLGAQRGLLKTLTESLVVTFLLMQVILLLAIRRKRIGLVAIVPNVFPVAATFLLMKSADIPLDIGTTMTAAIALGIAVDDTLHFVLAYERHGLDDAARLTGQAIVMSSVVIGAGFLVLLVTDFGPTQNFGLLAGAAMFTALFADLVVLPAALRWVDRP